jgi:hypothetical protein
MVVLSMATMQSTEEGCPALTIDSPSVTTHWDCILSGSIGKWGREKAGRKEKRKRELQKISYMNKKFSGIGRGVECSEH